jgi:hypothetical protein
MLIDEQHEKVNPYFVPMCSVTPASLAAPLFGKGQRCGESFIPSGFWIVGSINLQRPCLVPAMPG